MLHLPAEKWPDTLRAVAATGLVTLRTSPAFLLRLELDGARQGRTADLRPASPLLLRW